jgi:hypothetical protein
MRTGGTDITLLVWETRHLAPAAQKLQPNLIMARTDLLV